MTGAPDIEALWRHHHAEWRDPAQSVTTWTGAGDVDPRQLRGRARGEWWDLLDSLGLTLLVTREYEHLLMALSATSDGPRLSYLPLPHPSGLAVDRERGAVHVASTRNPNQVIELAPATGALLRTDAHGAEPVGGPLMPVASRFYPGCLYLHDLAFVGGALHGNAVGQNAVVKLGGDGYERVWWPRSIERGGDPDFSRNYLQLNSIAAGDELGSSFFSASSESPSARRPGHLDYPVDRRGVVFSGRAREPVARGLTRPHSARLHRGRLWIANSGYGELGPIDDGALTDPTPLPGWTRGLCFHEPAGVAFVGVSRVIPRFRRYAPGLDVDRSSCGVYAIEVESRRVLGSFTWPLGNQVFALELVERSWSQGLPFQVGRGRGRASAKRLFYNYDSPAVRGDRL
jgi:uncharacterized protein (TIGR03032 family)